MAPVLVVGLGYARRTGKAIAQRWPEIAVHGWNPFSADPVIAPAGEFGTVICPACWSGAAQPRSRPSLSQVHLQPDGLLLCQDALLAIGVQPAPQTALRVLARQVADGNVHSWSLDRLAASLQRAGFAIVESGHARRRRADRRAPRAARFAVRSIRGCGRRLSSGGPMPEAVPVETNRRRDVRHDRRMCRKEKPQGRRPHQGDDRKVWRASLAPRNSASTRFGS